MKVSDNGEEAGLSGGGGSEGEEDPEPRGGVLRLLS